MAYTFRLNLVLDMFWDKVDQTMIEAEVDKKDFGHFAGLPAGEGITKLTDIEQFYELQTTHYGTMKPDYITFKTDSIIPLDLYQLNSESDAYTGGHMSVGGHYYSSSTTLPIFTDLRLMGALFLYNRYYMVKLPDGSYVPAHLDDTYYMKYRLTGKVQLPIGIADHMPDRGQSALQPYLDEYDLNKDRILVMYSQKRYEDWELLYAGTAFLLFWVILILGLFIKEIIKTERKGGTTQNEECG
ncbi:MAG: hypothetical protein J1E64_15145 [Acetatifactor sp.]|nr:hypothetical protein [Acetatifactor sp.]